MGRGGIIVSDRYWVSLDGGESRSRECFSSAIGTKEGVCLLLRGPEGVCSSQTISGGFFMLLRCTHWIRTFFNKTKYLPCDKIKMKNAQKILKKVFFSRTLLKMYPVILTRKHRSVNDAKQSVALLREYGTLK